MKNKLKQKDTNVEERSTKRPKTRSDKVFDVKKTQLLKKSAFKHQLTTLSSSDDSHSISYKKGKGMS